MTCHPLDVAQIVPRGTILIALSKSRKAACQGDFVASCGVRLDSICAFFGANMHRETEAKFSERNEHFLAGVPRWLSFYLSEPLTRRALSLSQLLRDKGGRPRERALFSPAPMSPTARVREREGWGIKRFITR